MGFEFRRSVLQDVFVITPERFRDDRGYFEETFKRSVFEEHGIVSTFVQDNHSTSSAGVVRGLHYQLEPYAQGKLVSVLSGTVWDVAVDLRRSSETFGQHFGVSLSEERGTMLWIPPGFAHGFVALSETVHLVYKCTAEYAPAHERGIRYNDPTLEIPWPERDAEGNPLKYQLSQKDAELPGLHDAEAFA
ncbi:MAG: dTDP-4-dehydrorhamnose 3,5-epimerase [Alkalispirochaeta sp.]